jgi:hypothetical protein
MSACSPPSATQKQLTMLHCPPAAPLASIALPFQAALPESINIWSTAAWHIAENNDEKGAYISDFGGHVHLNCANLFPDPQVFNYDCIVLAALHKHRTSADATASAEPARLPLAAPVATDPVGRNLGNALARASMSKDEEEVFETPDQKRRKVVGQARPRAPLGESSTKADAPAQ